MIAPQTPANDARGGVWSELQACTDNLPVGVLGLDHRYVVRMANPGLVQLLGLPDDFPIIGIPAERLHEQVMIAPPVARFRSDEPISLECDIILKSGQQRRVAVSVFPVRGKRRILGTIILGKDLHWRPQPDRLTTKRALIHLDGIDIFLFDKSDRIVFCNRLPDTAVGLKLREAAHLAQTYETPVHPELLEYIATSLEAKSIPTHDDADPVEIAGRFYRVHGQRLGIEAGKAIGLAVFAYDVSEASRLRLQLRRSEQLASIGELAHNTAHELRNPLSAIRAIAQLGMRHTDADAKDRGFARILAEVDRLDHFIEDLLLLPQAPLTDLAPQHLTAIVEEVLVLVHGDLIAQRISVERRFGEALPPVEGEQKLLRRALLNLIVNAIEAMESGGRLALGARVLQSEHSRAYVQLTIGDTGRGLSKEEIEQLFSPFASGPRGARGLGIAVAHQVITQRHRGRLWISSTKGEGTLVTVELPVADAPTPPT